MSDVTVQAHRLPGVGWQYTVPAEEHRQVVIVVEDRGPRHVVLVDPRQDSALITVRLGSACAAVVAALLAGARFPPTFSAADQVETSETADPREVVVETVPITGGSPVVGAPPEELGARLGPDGVLLGVIDDRTLELVDSDAGRPIRSGDTLVVAARRARVEQLRAEL
jgi:K+/H+ antiporter YhaU regulatory subunit KhtT